MHDQPDEEHQPRAECPIFDAGYQKDSGDNDGCQVKQDYEVFQNSSLFLLNHGCAQLGLRPASPNSSQETAWPIRL